MSKKYVLTEHAAKRMNERKIPAALIQEAISEGTKTLLVDRKAVEHKIKNVLGIRGFDLIVITCADTGNILTSYVDRRKVSKKTKE